MISTSSAKDPRSIIYIVRHGECTGNFSKNSLEQAFLTENGIQQSKKLGKFLQDEKFTLAYSSDYPRCIETAHFILSGSRVPCNVPLQKNEMLRERYFGSIDKDLFRCLSSFIFSSKDLINWTPQEGESREDVERRVENFLGEIFSQVDECKDVQTILVVTHGAFILHLLTYLSESRNKYAFHNWKAEDCMIGLNTEYFKIAIQKNPPKMEPRNLEILTARGDEHLDGSDVNTYQKLVMDLDNIHTTTSNHKLNLGS